MKIDLATLRQFEIFKELNDREVENFLEIAEEAVYEGGQRIFEEKSLALNLYLVLEGKVEIKMKGDILEEPLTLDIVGPGETFGWSAIAEPHTFTASAYAVERTRVILLRGDWLRDLFKKNNHIGYRFMQEIASLISRRLRKGQLSFLKLYRERKRMGG